MKGSTASGKWLPKYSDSDDCYFQIRKLMVKYVTEWLSGSVFKLVKNATSQRYGWTWEWTPTPDIIQASGQVTLCITVICGSVMYDSIKRLKYLGTNLMKELQNLVTALWWVQQYGMRREEIRWRELTVKLTGLCHRKIFSSLKRFFPLFFKGH